MQPWGWSLLHFFALGVTLISGHTGNIDLDPSCILYGEIGLVPLAEKVEMSGIFLGNRAIWVMGVVFMCIGTGTFIILPSTPCFQL